MKQLIDLTKEPLSDNELRFILVWKKRKYNNSYPTLSIGECLEFIIAITYNLHKDYADGRFFNNILISHESVVAWDGEELIDILFYEIRSGLHQRLSTTRILD